MSSSQYDIILNSTRGLLTLKCFINEIFFIVNFLQYHRFHLFYHFKNMLYIPCCNFPELLNPFFYVYLNILVYKNWGKDWIIQREKREYVPNILLMWIDIT